MIRGSVKSIGYPLHSPASPSFPLPCATVCHHISTGLYPSFMIVRSSFHSVVPFISFQFSMRILQQFYVAGTLYHKLINYFKTRLIVQLAYGIKRASGSYRKWQHNMRLLGLKLNKRRWWHILFDATVISPYLSRQSLCFDKSGCHKDLGLALTDKKIHTVTYYFVSMVHFYSQNSLLTSRQSLNESSSKTKIAQGLRHYSSRL
jgi:hypothetical protein